MSGVLKKSLSVSLAVACCLQLSASAVSDVAEESRRALEGVVKANATHNVSMQAFGKEQREAIARGDYQIPIEDEDSISVPDNWKVIYPNTTPIFIGEVEVEASVADDLDERIKGLSDTPYLPENVVKLFVFGTYGTHSIWMKDMNYSIDIIWANKEGEIVHIEESISPETFPKSFGSPINAWYVVETSSGFVERNNIETGDLIQVP